jgi:predicted component of type VI protein secretion system
METAWMRLAEQRVFARPSTEEDAKAALEWFAAQEGKTLSQLVHELQTGPNEGRPHA